MSNSPDFILIKFEKRGISHNQVFLEKQIWEVATAAAVLILNQSSWNICTPVHWPNSDCKSNILLAEGSCCGVDGRQSYCSLCCVCCSPRSMAIRNLSGLLGVQLHQPTLQPSSWQHSNGNKWLCGREEWLPTASGRSKTEIEQYMTHSQCW